MKLTAAGVGEKNIRKLVASALHKAGYTKSPTSLKRKHESEGQGSVAGPSSLPDVTVTEEVSPAKGVLSVGNLALQVAPKKRIRKRKDKDGMLPEEPQDEATQYGSLQFGETLDEEV